MRQVSLCLHKNFLQTFWKEIAVNSTFGELSTADIQQTMRASKSHRRSHLRQLRRAGYKIKRGTGLPCCKTVVFV